MSKVDCGGHLSCLRCLECGVGFRRRADWKRHVKAHYVCQCWVCPLCPQVDGRWPGEKGCFGRVDNLRSHLRRRSEHGGLDNGGVELIVQGQKPVVRVLRESRCPVCGVLLDDVELLLVHYILQQGECVGEG